MSSFYDDASWVLIPSGIKEDVIYAQKPDSGLGDLVMTRASDATYTDASGVVRRSPYNLLQQSEMFSNAVWTKSNSTISIDATVAPNGTLTADKLIEDTALSTHLVLQLPAGSISGNIYTFSFYAKAAERFNVSAVNNAAGGGQATYNLNTGAVTFTSGISASMQSVGDGWYRCILTYSPTVTGNFNTHIRLANASGANSYQGDGVSGAFIWGAQLVEGNSVLDYFPTTNRQDVPRIDFRNADGTLSSCGRLLLEPQRTNSIRNSSMVGAVAGTTGTLPTNWEVISSVGLTRTVVGTGTENGLPYIDLRFAGTATGTTLAVWFESATQMAAVTGQTWTSSAYLKLISGSANSYQLTIREQDAGGASLRTAGLNVSPTSTLQRFTFTRTNDGVGTAFVRTNFLFALTVGVSYDVTIRIAAPQMELGGNVSTWIPTTTAATTRTADSASKSGVSSLIGQTEGTFFTEIQITPGVSRALFSIDIGATTNYILASINASAQVLFRVNQASTLTTLVTSSALTLGRHKLAFAYKAGQYALYIDGVQSGVSTSTSYPVGTLNQIVLNSASYGQFGDGYAEAILYPTRLDNATLAQMTTL